MRASDSQTHTTKTKDETMTTKTITAAVNAAIAASVQTSSIQWLAAEGDASALDCYRDALYSECDDHVDDVLGDDGRYDDFWGTLDGQTWRICVSH
jgi:hypothetical protein